MGKTQTAEHFPKPPVLLYSMGVRAKACLAVGRASPVFRSPSNHRISMPACRSADLGRRQGLSPHVNRDTPHHQYAVPMGGPQPGSPGCYRCSWKHLRKHLNPSEGLEQQIWKACIQKGAIRLPLLLKTVRAPQACYHTEGNTSK